MKRAKRAAKSAPPRPRTSMPWRAGVIVLAGVLAYWNSLSGPFVFDDRGTVLDNRSIEALWDRGVLSAPRETPVAGRPLVNVSFAINYALGGREVEGYHVANIAIHLLCALLVLGVLRPTLQSADLAFAVALIWTVHPLNSEAVNYVTQRTESLMAMFYLMTLYAATRSRHARPSGAWEMVAVGSCALGMACKESMVTAPLMVLVYDRVFLFESLASALRARRRLYAGLAATWLVLAALMATAPRSLSAGFSAHDAAPWTYLLNQAVMVTHYLRLAIWPRSLTLFYGWPLTLTLGDVWPYALFIGSLLAATIAALARRPRLGFWGVWFFVTLAPTSSIVPIATEVGAERRMYLPSTAVIALVVIGAFTVRDLVRRSWPRLASPALIRAAATAGRVVLVATTVLLAAFTHARNREYASSLVLAETTVERWPTPGAHSMLGTELAAAGRFDEAEAHLREAAPDYPPARYYLATVLARGGNTREAMALFQEFIKQQPPELDQVHLARGQLADLYMRQQQLEPAIEQYRMMIAAHPLDTDVRSLLANALVRQQSYDEAIAQYRLYLAERPDDGRALAGLGIALAAMGRLDEAITAFRRAVALDPGSAHAQQNLARALQMAAQRSK
jgi:Flp pilus assembly protein TadD